MATSSHIKGVRIQTVNMIMLAISLVIFLAVLYTTHVIYRTYNSTLESINDYVEWDKAARTIEEASNYLTDQAKLFASAKDIKYARNYFEELYEKRRRENSLNILAKHDLHSFDKEHNCELKKAVDLSNSLSDQEIYAILLIADAMRLDLSSYADKLKGIKIDLMDSVLAPGGKIMRAREILFGAKYQHAKDDIKRELNNFVNETTDNLFAQQKAQTRELGHVLQRERYLLILLCIFNVLTFAMIITLIVRPLRIYINAIKNDKMLEAIGAYEFKYLAFTYNDIFALKERHDQLMKHKAEHDPLTGLYNRAAYDSLRQILHEKNSPVGLLLVDVDKFKEINDTYGHKMGDRALLRVAKLLLSHFRADDYCIRMGGDEFAVIFDVGPEGMEEIIQEKIADINQKLLSPDDDLPPVSISAGVAISQKGFTENLYEDADSALYKVKEGGRRGVAFYKPSAK